MPITYLWACPCHGLCVSFLVLLCPSASQSIMVLADRGVTETGVTFFSQPLAPQRVVLGLLRKPTFPLSEQQERNHLPSTRIPISSLPPSSLPPLSSGLKSQGAGYIGGRIGCREVFLEAEGSEKTEKRRWRSKVRGGQGEELPGIIPGTQWPSASMDLKERMQDQLGSEEGVTGENWERKLGEEY